MNYEGFSENKARRRQQWLSSVSLDLFEFMRVITSFLLLSVATVCAQTRDYPKTPKDKPVHSEGAQQMTDIERAIQPYVAKARKTYPAAKRRFLAGLPPKYLFSLTTKLWDRSHTKFEVVFVVADEIKNGTVTGHLATHTKRPVGYNFGDKISFQESQVIDWTIVHPDEPKKGTSSVSLWTHTSHANGSNQSLEPTAGRCAASKKEKL